jgi:hypothetical protein
MTTPDGTPDAMTTPDGTPDAMTTPDGTPDAMTTPAAAVTPGTPQPGALTAASEELCEEIQNLLETELDMTFERTATAQIEEGFDLDGQTGEGCLLVTRGDAAGMGEAGDIENNLIQTLTDAGWSESPSGIAGAQLARMTVYRLTNMVALVSVEEEDGEPTVRIYLAEQNVP